MFGTVEENPLIVDNLVCEEYVFFGSIENFPRENAGTLADASSNLDV